MSRNNNTLGETQQNSHGVGVWELRELRDGSVTSWRDQARIRRAVIRIWVLWEGQRHGQVMEGQGQSWQGAGGQ